jgi:RimJ/RimL family protein N-acetyltransferase
MNPFDLPLPPLEGRRVRLEPLHARHLPGLAAAIADGELWKLPVTFVPHPDDLPAFLADADAARQAGRELAFASIDMASRQVVGSTRFRCIEPAHRKLEIGFTFIARRWQRSHVNTEAKYLMLRHAFETWQCHRVELLTDVLNTASRAAIERLGAQREGLLRQHLVMRDGRIRDSVLYSLVADEWPQARERLEARMRTRGSDRIADAQEMTPEPCALHIRPFEETDTEAVIALWQACGLTRPWNDPRQDIARKLQVQREWFLVGERGGEIVASAMAGYDGHRGWVNYLAVSPQQQRHGFGRQLMQAIEARLSAFGCPKINLQVRSSNAKVLAFYARLGYATDDVVSLGKRLIADAPREG